MKNESLDWTEPAHLEKSDWTVLKQIKHLHSQGLMNQAMLVAQSTDTIVRDEIPIQIWLDMGGTLTDTGLEELRRSKKKETGRGRGL